MRFKKILLIFAFALLFSKNAYAEGLSSWALADFEQMSRTGLINSELLHNDMSGKITRKEFCRLVMNLYRSVENVTVTNKDKTIFEDTDDTYIIKAYKAGIVNGKGEKTFAPDDYITRQEMAVMLSRMLNKSSENYILFTNQIKTYKSKFKDSNETSDWALDAMSAICHYNIITGISENTVEPYSFATREQAICMLNRINKEFIPNDTEYSLPEVESVFGEENEVNIKWRTVSGAKSYNVIIKRAGYEPLVLEYPARVRSIEKYKLETNDFKYTVSVEAVIDNNISVISVPVEVDTKIKPEEKAPVTTKEDEKKVVEKGGEEDTQTENEDVNIKEEESDSNEEEINESYQNYNLTLEEKEKRVFPDGVPFESFEVALEYMAVVEVPVWRLNSDGSKSESKKYITVNKALKEDVLKIFTEIFNDASKFPIKDAGGYTWRNTALGKISQHSYGTCIDINYNENYYVTPDGTPITGTHWSPGVDPYSIAEDSIVVKTFAKYGWLWGGNAWGEGYNKDYMHFTYLGK